MSDGGATPYQPVVISMDVDDDEAIDAEYRIRIGDQIRYLTISGDTFDRDTLSFPVPSLPPLPDPKEWTVARVSRDKASGQLKVTVSNRTLKGVKCQWHQTKVDFLELERTKQLTSATYEATLPSDTSGSRVNVIVKIANFEWEIPRIERETRAYQLLEGSGVAPRFLGHVHENGRIMGLFLEKIEGQSASIEDLSACEAALGRFHALGFLHGDVNRYNFLVTDHDVRLIDFEETRESKDVDLKRKEMQSLRAELVDESGRGGGFMPME